MLIEALLLFKENKYKWSLTGISEALCRVTSNSKHAYTQNKMETQAAEEAQIVWCSFYLEYL